MLKVMIVDDDKNVSDCLHALIPWSDLGYEIVADAINGEDAMELFFATNPNVIITDLKMPVMDGTEFCSRVRSYSDNISIIFLSAYEDFHAAREALRFHVTDYILKPLNGKKIQQIITLLKSIAKSHYHQELYHRIITESSIANDFINQLNQGNVTYFDDFFQDFADCAVADYMVVQDACAKLIHILFDFLLYSQINIQLVECQRKNHLIEMQSLQKKTDKVTYTSKLYSDLLQFSRYGQEDYYTLSIKRIKEYIEGNFQNSSICVSSVADKFSFSSDYIGKIFSKHCGMSINSYIAKLRMDKAVKLLTGTELSMNEIADRIGYSGQNYFIRVFKKQYGITPGEYRALAIKNGSVNISSYKNLKLKRKPELVGKKFSSDGFSNIGNAN